MVDRAALVVPAFFACRTKLRGAPFAKRGTRKKERGEEEEVGLRLVETTTVCSRKKKPGGVLDRSATELVGV